MEFDENPGGFTGVHIRPATTPDAMFNRRSVGAFIVPAIGYGIMAAFTPTQLGPGIWLGVVLFVLPVVCGLIVHSIGDLAPTRRRMIRAALLTFICFFIYSLVNMSLINDRIQSAASGLGAFPAMLITAIGYGFVAAMVSGLTASLPVHHLESHR